MLIFLTVLMAMIIVVAAVAYGMGFFRIEKVEIEEETPDNQLELDAPEAPQEEELELKDKMDIAGFFDEDEERPEPVVITEERLSLYDPLSELKTGRGYLIDAQKLLTEAKNEGSMYAAVYFDFDRFRFINSLKGFSIGDYVLTRMGQEMLAAFPEIAQATRISADHFAVVFPLVDEGMFEEIADRLNLICEKIRGDMAIKSGLRVCMGVAVTDNIDRDYDVSVLLHKANLARHSIKTSRTEMYKLFDDAMTGTNLFGESAMEDYNENQFDEEFVIYYVPQEDTTLHRIAGSEALVRWIYEDDNDHNSPPSLGKGKLPTNGTKAVYQVCKAMGRWRKAGKEIVQTSVGLPVTELFKEDLDEFIAKCLSEFQLEPRMLAIVLDAAAIRLDWSSASRQLKRLHDIGVEVGVDEIDIGYSSLEFLDGLPVSFVKFHRSFAYGVDTDPQKQEAARKICDAAKQLQLRTIFEGVDTLEQSKALQDCGARMIQGLSCGRPQQWEAFSQGLLDYVEKQKRLGDVTVILDDVKLTTGDYNLF